MDKARLKGAGLFFCSGERGMPALPGNEFRVMSWLSGATLSVA